MTKILSTLAACTFVIGLSLAGAVTFRSSTNVTVEDSKITAVKGDGFWIEKVSGVKLLNNTVTSANGSTADAMQLNDSSNILIKGNHLDQTHGSNSSGISATTI